MPLQHLLLHDYFKNEAMLEPAFKGDVGCDRLHNVNALPTVLLVHGCRQGRVECHGALEDREGECLYHVALEDGICLGLQGQDAGSLLFLAAACVAEKHLGDDQLLDQETGIDVLVDCRQHRLNGLLEHAVVREVKRH